MPYKDSEQAREYRRRRYQANKSQILAKNKEYHIAHREELAVYTSAWRKAHPEQCREYHRVEYYTLKDELYELLGGAKCVRCGFLDKRALQFDHIVGYEESLKNGGYYGRTAGRDYMRYWTKHPEEAKRHLQVLCANCNWIKRAENGETYGYIKNRKPSTK